MTLFRDFEREVVKIFLASQLTVDEVDGQARIRAGKDRLDPRSVGIAARDGQA